MVSSTRLLCILAGALIGISIILIINTIVG